MADFTDKNDAEEDEFAGLPSDEESVGDDDSSDGGE